MGLFRPERRGWLPEPLVPPVYQGTVMGNGSSNAGRNPAVALTVPTVWACVSLLANAVSMLPLETFRDTADSIPDRITDPMLVSEPAAGMTQSEWLHMLMVSLLLRGNALGRIVDRDARGFATQVELLNPDRVRIEVDDDTGRITYISVPTGREIPAEDIWHVRGMTLPGSKIGLSPIAYAASVLGVDIGSRTFAGDFFGGSAIPTSIITTDKPVDQPTAQTIKERWRAAVNRREPVVMGLGMKYESIQVSPEESQFLLTQEASVGQIARYFGVPAPMVGGKEGGSLTYSNREDRSLDFLTYGVNFWLKRIEDAMFVLLPKPHYVRFNTDPLLRMDAETAAKVETIYLAGKVKAPSEVRAKLSLPPMTQAQKDEADLVPLTITPLGGAKALPNLKIPPGDPAPVPDDEQGADDAAA